MKSLLTATAFLIYIQLSCFSTCSFSLVSGMIFFNAGGRDDSISTNFNSHFGAISSILMSAMFGPAQVVLLEFPLKRPMFMREFATGTCTYMQCNKLTGIQSCRTLPYPTLRLSSLFILPSRIHYDFFLTVVMY